MSLHIADDQQLPLEAVTQTFGVLGKRGSGKTSTGVVMVEEMIANELPVVVVDPVGVWWGLRSGPQGGESGGLPVAILGGEYGDIPLEETAGALVAQTVIEQPGAFVLDLSLLRKKPQRTFMTGFLEELYAGKATRREALHVVIDEADAFAPQRPIHGAERLLGACEDLVRRGRARGLGVTMITQRPASINKDVLTQIECLVCMKLTGPQDRKAVDDWIRLNADSDQRDEFLSTLAQLDVGQAWFWSPGWLGAMRLVQVRRRSTFDSSATPEAGQSGPTARFSPVDLGELQEAMADLVERADADDPRKLRARVAELEKRIAEMEANPEIDVQIDTVEVPFVPDGVADLVEEADAAAVTLESLTEDLGAWLDELNKVAPNLALAVRQIDVDLPGEDELVARHETSTRPARQKPVPRPAPASTRPAASVAPPGDFELGKGEHKILTAVVQHGSVTRPQLTVLTGYKRSTRNTYLQRLSSSGYVDTQGDRLVPTPAGEAAVGDVEPLPTGRALQQYWLGELPAGEAAILDQLLDVYPDGVPRDVLSERTGYKRSTRNTYLQRMAAKEIIETSGDVVYASEMLF